MAGQTIAIRSHFSAWTEIDEGLRRMGHTTVPFTDFETLTQLLDGGAELDFVLSINYDPRIHECCRARDIPQAVWTFDSGMSRVQRINAFRPNDRLFIFNRQDFEALSRQHEFTWYLPFSAGPSHQRTVRTEAYDSDVLVVMNSYRGAMAESEEKYQEAVAGAGDDVTRQLYQLTHAIMNLVVDRHLPIIHEDRVTALVMEQIESCGVNPLPDDPIRREMLFFPYGQILSSIQREAMVRRLAGVASVDLYGDDLWTGILGPDTSVGFHGQADYAGLPDLYNAARINVNLTQVQNLDSMAQRVFHVIAAGGFLLSNGRAESDYFADGVHYVYFRDLDDLAEKVRYYLEHEDERITIARQGHEEFIAQHTMQQRLQFILEHMR